MILFKKAADLRNWLDRQLKTKRSIGFVPTMGALHAGHISLISASVRENDLTVCSIFVNPTQFNDPADFSKYPITIENDIEMLETAGCDVLFLPPINEMYPDGPGKEQQHYELGYVESILEGQYRPGHFQGVCMIVHRLLKIVQPSQMYLGQKDFQQCMVIKKLIDQIDLPRNPTLVISPTLRESSGLAMSSRNMRLSEADKKNAEGIYQCLEMIRREIKVGAISSLKEKALNKLLTAGFKPDYVEIADANDLTPVEVWDGKKKLVVLIVAFLGDVRLIDNVVI